MDTFLSFFIAIFIRNVINTDYIEGVEMRNSISKGYCQIKIIIFSLYKKKLMISIELHYVQQSLMDTSSQ